MKTGMENGTMEYGYNIQQANTAPNSPNLSSGNSSPLPGTPNQILRSRLLRNNSSDPNQLQFNRSSSPRSDVHHPGLFHEIVNNKFVLSCALFASLGGILFGYDQGVISVTLVMDHFNKRFPEIDPTRSSKGTASFWKGFLTAMIELGAVLGVMLAGFMADRYGRKSAIKTGSLVFIVGSIIQTSALNLVMLLIGRFVGGIGIGILSMACPMYMGEISPNNIRGALLCLEEFNIVFGIVVAFWITYMTRSIESEVSWRLPFGIQLLPAIIILLGLSVLPSSPSWLASQRRYKKCLETISILRQLPMDDRSVRQEWIDIRVEAEFQREINLARFGELPEDAWSLLKIEFRKWGDTFSKGCRHRTLVGVGLSFFQQFVGINALIYYSPTLFETLGLDVELRLKMSGIMNMCQLFGVTISFLFIDKVGRRPLLLLGSILMAVCHLSVAILIWRYSADWSQHQSAGWAGVGFLLLYMVVFGLSWGPIPWAMPSEIFPSSLRAKGVAVSTMSNWINNFIIGFITPPLIEKTHEGAFIFFAFNSLLSWVFVWFVVPETAYRSLEEMDQVFGDKLAVEDQLKKSQLFHKIVSEEELQ
ncbi:hypothetical protein Pst134EA_009493 [Puccinia striiformis f. sp. tritici]|uniref:hypothetical protein n=1 Tax=Puccinia striiformis f. sp. tritici TaxID=168172 RepID=UPI002008ACBD|nr:hypothetical protein Pst134EA_009493 [Puccinia striiformis f. sp. tritici]KAH9468969.1 hypothetical protein Pst134EA_009493 [Puccinia striiformis f. sp. tritici]